MRKRFFAALLSFVMIFSLLPTSVLAANSNANDKIKITVRVFDPVTGGTWVVGEDTCQKADKYVQSVEYEIPALSKFVKNNTQTVQKVVGNWYFPAGDRWVGATVEWSNNASNVTMTYWVNNFKFAGDDGGTGGGSSGSGTEESGSGNYSMTYTIVYHSNYPSGTDYQQTFSYTIRAGYNIGNTGRTVSVKSLNDLDFTAPEGYKVAAHPWNTAKDGSGTSVDSMCYVKPHSTTHLYAQWAPATTTEYVTLTYMDGDTKYAEKSYEKDKTVTVIDCTTQKTGYTFKGWDTDKAATTVVYGTDSTFTIKTDTTLYAVWEEDGPIGPDLPRKADVQHATVRIQCVQPESVVKHNDSENAIAGAIGTHPSAYQLGTEVKQGTYNGETRYYVDCEITDVTPYIADFNNLYSGHTEATEPEHVLKFKLWYCPENENVQGKHVWEADTVPTIYVKCEAAPSKPTEDQQKDMLTGKIKVTCVLDDENLGRKENEAHQPAGVYALEAGGYTGADSVVWNSTYNCWTYAITVNKDYYVDKFNAEKKLPHTEVSSATTAFTFKWDSSTSSWSLLEAPGIENPSATNDIWCEIRVKDVYSPGNDELKNLIGKVKVVDDNTTSCGDKDYDLITTGDALMKMPATIAQGQYDLTRYIITVKAQPYVDAYNADMKAAGKYDKHELNSGATMTLTVEYVAGTGWTIADGKVPLEVHIKHSSAPDPSVPDKDKLNEAVLDSIVRIECATAFNEHSYVVKQLKDAAATNYTVAYTDGDNTATVTITNAQAYADLFKPDNMTHTFDASNSGNRLSFTLKWSKNATSGVWGWALEDQTAYAKIMTTCNHPGPGITPPEEYLKQNYVVKVTHIDDGATHEFYNNNNQLLLGGSPDDYEITPVTTDSNGVTTCTVTIKNAKLYVDWYDQAVADPNPVTIYHRLAANETATKSFQMTWNAAAKKWDYEIVEYKVTCANPSTDTHHVNYSYVSGVTGVELPTEIANAAPSDSTAYAKGATVKLAAKPNDVTVGDYVWSFQTWKIGTEEKDPEATVTMPDGDLNVMGIWTRQHTAPGAEDIKKALGAEEKTVKVVCVTALNQHNEHDYQAVIGLPEQYELFPAEDYCGFTGYPVSLNTGLFLAKYIADEGMHTLTTGTPDTITWIVYWNDTESEWRADPYNDAAKKSIDVEHVNYTVSFDKNGGTGTMNSETVIAGSKYTLPACGFTAPSNKKFDGWEINGTKYAVGASIEVNSNVIVKALWTDKGGSGSGGSHNDSYTLRYDTNGGEKLSSESKTRKWTKDYEDLPIPTREGYRFDGWYYDSKLKNEVTGDVKVNTSVVTLYAGWTAVEVPSMLNGDDHFAYVQGYKDGNVRPYGLISRAETTTIFFRLLKDSVRDGNLLTSNTYTDVTGDYWANTAISTMTGLGIVQGRSADTFDPNAPITRAQFAAICARFDTGKTYGSQSFSDIQGHWAQAYIERAAELGWIKGFEDGTFRPDTYITRAQAMTMINRVLNRTPDDEDDLLDNMNVWPDCTPNDWFYLAVQEATNSHDFKYQGGEVWTKLTKAPDWSRYEH
ncbi:MAG: hypothetical protein BHV93_15890 [Clostridiales bacterium 52_15]|nr:MAG: hypothetical protein BHV93_15890 [Clostridiales bacterium 52_15]